MTPVVRNRLLAVGALLVAGAALAFIAFGKLEQNIVYYWTPEELLAKGESAYSVTVRLGGMVQPGSVQWDEQHTHLKFKVANGLTPDKPAVLVSSTQVPPQMFREGIGVVVEGTYDASGVFTSNRLLVSHSNEYRAPGQGHEQDWKNTVSEAEATLSNTPR